MPTPSAYILAAVLVGPTLMDLGFSTMQGNLFLLYFAVLSAMTPPVAVAAFAAAAIADANPLEIGAIAVRLSITAFVVPFAFITGDGLILQGGIERILVDCLTAAAGVVLLAYGVEGYLRAPLGAAGLALISPNAYGIVLALALLGVALAVSPGLRAQSLAMLRRDPL